MVASHHTSRMTKLDFIILYYYNRCNQSTGERGGVHGFDQTGKARRIVQDVVSEAYPRSFVETIEFILDARGRLQQSLRIPENVSSQLDCPL